MLLVADAGNSNMVVGLYDGEDLLAHWRLTTGHYRTADELSLVLHMLLQQQGFGPGDVQGCCVASVVPPLDPVWQNVCLESFGTSPVMVGPGVKSGLVIQVENPKEVGADRIVDMVGALDQYPAPLIVVDFGTATTFDAVTAKREYRGGVIAPGVQIAANALFEQCAKLPRVMIERPPAVIGRNTVTNITSGLTYGFADLTDGLVRRMDEELGGGATVVATGGFAFTIAELSSTIGQVDPWLTLRGLRIVYEKNAQAGP
jgi:type III pantothenate kinase